MVGLLIIAPILMKIIPRYEKWEPALIPLTLISINTFFAAATTNLTNLLNAIGKIKTTFKLMIMWTALTWLFLPFLGTKYGINGVALGYALVGISSVVAIVVARKIVKFSIYESVLIPLISSLIMGVVLLLIKQLLPTTLFSVGTLICIGALAYGFVIYKIKGDSVLIDAKRVFGEMIGRK